MVQMKQFFRKENEYKADYDFNGKPHSTVSLFDMRFLALKYLTLAKIKR
jgi:hypothetical protein